MHKLTQTQSGNCWQTCVAMLLGVPADALPDQLSIGRDVAEYAQALRVYLYRHHGMTYVEAPMEHPLVRRGFHLMIGECPRSTADNDVWHAVVGYGGQMYWDVNASRAGLTKVVKAGLVIPFEDAPKVWREEWLRTAGSCVCPACEEKEVLACLA